MLTPKRRPTLTIDAKIHGNAIHSVLEHYIWNTQRVSHLEYLLVILTFIKMVNISSVIDIVKSSTSTCCFYLHNCL